VGDRVESSSSLSQTEAEIRAFLAQGDAKQAATALLRAYSDEILGYLVNTLRDRDLAREAFAMFARDLWQGLPKVELEASARAWAYALARNAGHRLVDRVVRKRWRELPMSQFDAQLIGAHETRPLTPPYMQTENKQRLASLRARLTLEEQELLTLRLDRGFDFREIAVALGAGADELELVSARQRKRFQLIKRKLAKWLREER
jgi:RNA polymerase sigma-70 factor (ECF subfamily)